MTKQEIQAQMAALEAQLSALDALEEPDDRQTNSASEDTGKLVQFPEPDEEKEPESPAAEETEPEEVPLEIVVDDGVEIVPVKNSRGKLLGQLELRTTDLFGLLDRYNALVDGFDEIVKPFDEVDESDDSDEAVERRLEAMKQAEERLKKELDYVLGCNASEAFFREITPFTPVHGMFYCEAVLNQVSDFMANRFSVETHKIKRRLNKNLTPNRQARLTGQKGKRKRK